MAEGNIGDPTARPSEADGGGREMDGSIMPPEPGLTPAEMLRRATALRPVLRARQAECEAAGRVSEETNRALIAAGFYRIVQPRRFGGYEFDIPTFYKVMMEVSRGCTETGWVLALTAGHTILLARFPEEAQRDAYGGDGEFRCPRRLHPARPCRAGSRRLSAGRRLGVGLGLRSLDTHFIGMGPGARRAADADPGPDRAAAISYR